MSYNGAIEEIKWLSGILGPSGEYIVESHVLDFCYELRDHVLSPRFQFPPLFPLNAQAQEAT